MTAKAKPSFLGLFLGGFTIGAVALVSVQAAQADDRGPVVAPIAATR